MRFSSVLVIRILDSSPRLDSMSLHACSQAWEFQVGADNSSIRYPNRIIPDEQELRQTYYGRFGDSRTMEMYAWPLIWTNSFTGK